MSLHHMIGIRVEGVWDGGDKSIVRFLCRIRGLESVCCLLVHMFEGVFLYFSE